MSNYAVGARLERLARAQLQRAGYCVIRSAGSKGAFDLIAWNAERVRFIQIKAFGAARKADIEILRITDVPANCTRELWVRDGGTTEWEVTTI